MPQSAADTWDDVARDYATFAKIMEQVHPQVAGWILAELNGWAQRREHTHTPLSEVIEGLDIGCGSGVYTKLLTAQCRSVRGYDPSLRMVQLAWEQSADNRIGYLVGMPDPIARTDVVLSTFAAHHMGPDIFTTYAYLRDQVRPGGLVLLADVICDNAADWQSRPWHVERAKAYCNMTYAATSDGDTADMVYRIMTGEPWLSHVMADLPPTEVQMLYAARSVMPQCTVRKIVDGVGAVRWVKPMGWE